LHLLAAMPVGGAEDMVAAVVRGLDPETFEMGCAVMGEPGPVGEELRAAGYPMASLGLDLKRHSTRRLVAGVRRLLREVRPDILHTHLYHPNLYGRLAALGLGLRGIVATVHNLYTRVKLHRCLWNRVLGRVSDYVMVFSPRVGQDVRRYDGVPEARLRLVSPGVRVEALQLAATPGAARERLGLAGFVVGTVARLEEQKGHEYLLEAVHRVLPEIPELCVVLVGDGQRRANIEKQVEDLGLTRVVRLLGTRRDVPLILRALDLFLQPSLWEGIPLTLLEAMAAGLPVISTRVGRAPEVIREGDCGRLVPPGDSGALAAAILDAYRHPEQRRNWAAQARRRIVEHYSQEAMLRQFADLYRELYARRSGQ
jgi:glycosyltransferase involved in cell wall biosynthesis